MRSPLTILYRISTLHPSTLYHVYPTLFPPGHLSPYDKLLIYLLLALCLPLKYKLWTQCADTRLHLITIYWMNEWGFVNTQSFASAGYREAVLCPWAWSCSVATGKSDNSVDCQLCISKMGEVLLPTGNPRASCKQLSPDRSILRARNCWLPIMWLSPGRGLPPSSSPWFVTIIELSVQLIETYWGPTTCRAHANQYRLPAQVLRRKPTKCRNQDLSSRA